MTSDCTRALDRLRLALEAGTQLEPEALAHLERCPTCRADLGAALKWLGADQEAGTDLDPALAEAAVRGAHRRRLIWRSLAVGATLAAAFLGGLSWLGVVTDEAALPALLPLGALPWVILAFWLARTPARFGLYKRLGPGRQLSGVCLGLGQRTGTPTWAWRLGLVLLCLLPGIGHATGLWLYLLLDLAMPVHPDDRRYRLRFRLARWWRGARARTA